jgi:hypothetical protein
MVKGTIDHIAMEPIATISLKIISKLLPSHFGNAILTKATQRRAWPQSKS